MMTNVEDGWGARGLLIRIKYAYWLAMLLVAAMTAFSFVKLDTIVSAQNRYTNIIILADEQATVVRQITSRPLSNIIGGRALLEQFSANHDTLMRSVAAEGSDGEGAQLVKLLNQTGNAFKIAARQSAWPIAETPIQDAYEAVKDHFSSRLIAGTNSAKTLNRSLFGAMIALIALVVILIFRPLSSALSKNVAELVKARNSMAHFASHDSLTGLHNRAFLIDQFQSMISEAERCNEHLAVLQIDLDDFKDINDTLGHAAGDRVLIETAKRLLQSCGTTDLCVRLGGDEFVVILSAAGEAREIEMAASRILEHINEAIDFEGVAINAGASAGVAIYPADGHTADDLLVHADLALYDAKKRGGGEFAFFSSKLRTELDQRNQLESDLKQAIEAEAFEVYFQPQVSLIDGSVAGVEALIRWTHLERGVIMPGDFMPVARKSGLMSAIGRIGIKKAMAGAAKWHREGIAFGRLAVNVSGAELCEPDFADFLFETLKNVGLPAQKLSLEIVESVILDDDRLGIAARLRQIRAAGVHLELDDFGTGFVSLAQVNPNEVDRLKIDRCFVQNINNDDSNAKIVKAITELARGLGLSIVAEGAETQEELDQLIAIGCEEAQGFSIAYPMPEQSARNWLDLHAAKKQVVKLDAWRKA